MIRGSELYKYAVLNLFIGVRLIYDKGINNNGVVYKNQMEGYYGIKRRRSTD